MSTDDLLAPHREAIDHIDQTILSLLNERAAHARAIGELKGSGVVYRPEREAQVLRRIQDGNPGPLSDEAVTWLFREVMSACLSLEQPLSVAFLGPLGSFTGTAATKHFGHAARLLPQASIDDVFREVEAGHAHYAVVPVENSTEGAVGRSMDLLFSTPLKVCGEVVLRIHQNLMTRETSLDKVTKVYSHAQSLAQCHEWLNRNLPNVPRISVGSNSQAAEMAMQEEGAAAIALRFWERYQVEGHDVLAARR